MPIPTTYILALDQGTTSSRAIVFNHQAEVVAVAQQAFEQYFPQPGWVEHNPDDIWDTQLQVARDAIKKAGIEASRIAAIGITNQRETTLVWNRKTGKAIGPAIVWQDRRTSAQCDRLRQEGYAEMIAQKTGLLPDAYFSASKVQWILDHTPGARQMAEQGELCFGTVDSWLVWKFTGGTKHFTDVSNASRTMLYNIHSLQWDHELLRLFNIPASMLPEVKSCSEVVAETDPALLGAAIPIAGIAGDQQAALFGHLCLEPGHVKNTYGTGSFMVMNTGSKAVTSTHRLLTTIAWTLNGKITYALEGSIFSTGASVQWLRDGLGIIKEAQESDALAQSVPDNGGVYFVPALTGLGAPYWDPYARGLLIGITRGSTAAHICRATLESITYQVWDVLQAMVADTGREVTAFRVDGGATANGFLMQYQANVLGLQVIRPGMPETTALGAAYLAGLAVGYWKNTEELMQHKTGDVAFTPQANPGTVQKALAEWHRAVNRATGWEQPPQANIQ